MNANPDIRKLQASVVLIESIKMQQAMRDIAQAKGFRAMDVEIAECRARVVEDLRDQARAEGILG